MEKKKPSWTLKRPSVQREDVIGLDKFANELLRVFIIIKENYESDIEFSSLLKKHIFLHGPKGVGKRQLIYFVSTFMQYGLLQIECQQLVNTEPNIEIEDIFYEATRYAPIIVYFRHVDAIAKSFHLQDTESRKNKIFALSKCLEDLKIQSNGHVIVIGTSTSECIDNDLLDKFWSVAVSLPDINCRLNILKKFTETVRLSQDVNLQYLAEETSSFTKLDLHMAVEKTLDFAIKRCFKLEIAEIFQDIKHIHGQSPSKRDSEIYLNDVVTKIKEELKTTTKEKTIECLMKDFMDALSIFQPSFIKDGFRKCRSTKFSAIGGNKRAKEELESLICFPYLFPKTFTAEWLKPPHGLLLYGPNGCGKKMLAKAVAFECKLNFLYISGVELSNRGIEEFDSVFNRVRYALPCIFFIDEMDIICPKTKSSNIEYKRVMKIVRSIDILSRYDIIVVGSAKDVDEVDSSLLSEMRLKSTIFVDLPTADDRVDILKKISEDKTKPKIGNDVDFENIGHDLRCNKFSGADISNLIHEATLNAVREYIKISESRRSIVEVRLKHFEEAFSKVKASGAEEDIDKSN